VAGVLITLGRDTAPRVGLEGAQSLGRTHGGERTSQGLLELSRRARNAKSSLIPRVKHSIRRAHESLRSSELRKRSIIDLGEVILRTCRETISGVHSGRIGEARRALRKSSRNFKKFLKITGSASHLQHWGYTIQVVQEFLEASLLLSIYTGEEFFPLDELDALPELAILYGVSDVIGELRRRILASLADEDLSEVMYLFNTMTELYGGLSSISLADSVAPGLRRKLDVNRSTLESTLSDVTEELSRRKLARSIDQLTRRLHHGN
jgi:predicted translin family RNA/ssDNA-binding protein